jgi:hypothetical protein
MDERSIAGYFCGDLGRSLAFPHFGSSAACKVDRSAEAREVLGWARPASQANRKVNYANHVKQNMPSFLARIARSGASCASFLWQLDRF